MVTIPVRIGIALAAVVRVAMILCTVTIVATVLGISVGPRFLSYQTFVVLSSSMAPEISVGSVVVGVPVGRSDLAVGDVITYQRIEEPDLPVTHRIVSLRAVPGAVVARTKGDANEVADPWEVQLSPTVLRVAFAIPLAGYALYFAQTLSGRLLTIGVPLVALGAIGTYEFLSARRFADAGATTTTKAA
jgi:signal peptidase